MIRHDAERQRQCFKMWPTFKEFQTKVWPSREVKWPNRPLRSPGKVQGKLLLVEEWLKQGNQVETMKNSFKIFGRGNWGRNGSMRNLSLPQWEDGCKYNAKVWMTYIHFPCENLLKGNIEILFIYSENSSFSTYYYKDSMYTYSYMYTGNQKLTSGGPLSHLLDSKNLQAYFNHLPMGQPLKCSPKLCVLPHTDTKWCFS